MRCFLSPVARCFGGLPNSFSEPESLLHNVLCKSARDGIQGCVGGRGKGEKNPIAVVQPDSFLGHCMSANLRAGLYAWAGVSEMYLAFSHQL